MSFQLATLENKTETVHELQYFIDISRIIFNFTEIYYSILFPILNKKTCPKYTLYLNAEKILNKILSEYQRAK